MIFRKISELGNPGMVSRWAAQTYSQIKQNQPEVNDHEVITLILWTRFNTIQPNQRQYLESIIARSLIHNIADAVEFILGQEVDYFRNSRDHIMIMKKVITEQLLKNGVPHHMVFGKIHNSPVEPEQQLQNTIKCPYCNVSLRIPKIYQQSEFRCSSCNRAFNVKP